jgi:hypothetical protein
MDYLSGRVKNLNIGIPGYTNDTQVAEVVGDVEVKGDLNAESLKVNSNEVWHVGNKPNLGSLANVDDTARIDKSVVVFNQTRDKYVIDDVNTVITITDGGNF